MRWLRCTLIANGVPPELPLEDAITVAFMLVELGRAIPPRRWVDRFLYEQMLLQNEGAF